MTTNRRRLKVALIGCGKIADSYADEICRIHDVELAAVCDSEILMAERLKIRYGIPWIYDNVDRLLAEQQPHVVHGTTPPQSHRELARKSFAAECHVYM